MEKRTGSFLNQAEGTNMCTTNRSEPEIDDCAANVYCSRMKTLEKVLRTGGGSVVKIPNNRYKRVMLEKIEGYRTTEHEPECQKCRFRYTPSSK